MKKLLKKNDKTITISKIEYNRLLDRDNHLRLLEFAGIEHWKGILTLKMVHKLSIVEPCRPAEE